VHSTEASCLTQAIGYAVTAGADEILEQRNSGRSATGSCRRWLSRIVIVYLRSVRSMRDAATIVGLIPTHEFLLNIEYIESGRAVKSFGWKLPVRATFIRSFAVMFSAAEAGV